MTEGFRLDSRMSSLVHHFADLHPDDVSTRDVASQLEESDSPRTDLAIEAHELATRNTSPSGVEVSTEDFEGGIHVSRVHVRTEKGAKAIGKKKGRYVTFEVPGLRRRDPDLQQSVAERFGKEIEDFLNLGPDSSVLVVGLGNSSVTPDSLGPSVVKQLFVTRHLFRYMPEVLNEGCRTVSAVSPGVLGVTGIETGEIVQGIVEHVKPDAVIAVDALAARALNRVNTTIQIADTGIQPGSGVGNRRKALDKETLGVPCFAIGVPTVVEAATIANDSIELVLAQLKQAVPDNAATKIFDHFSPTEKWQMIRELLEPIGDNLMVTPKEIDEFIDDIARVVAKGLNFALHPGLSLDDVDVFTH